MSNTNADIISKINTLVKKDNELEQTFNYFSAIGMTPEAALDKLTLIDTLKQMMKDGVAYFVFTKVNGEVREAYGTRADDILRTHNAVPGGRRRASATTFSYYDIEKGDWRCFKPELLLRICTDYTI